MADVKTERISRQLKAQADSILRKTGNGLAQDLLVTCAALLRLADEATDPDRLDQVEQDMLTDRYQQVAGYVTNFVKKAGLDIREEDVLAQGSSDRLTTLRNRRQQLNLEAEKRGNEIKEISREISGIRQRINDNEGRLRELEEEAQKLKESLQKYTPELFSIKEMENQKLSEKFVEEKALFEEADQERVELENKVADIQNRIDALPESLKALRSQMDTLNAELERIQQAEETCNAEKQEEVREKIERLNKQLEEDKNAYEKVETLLNELRKSNIKYDEQNQKLDTEAIALMNEIIRTLRPKLDEHQKKLRLIRDENAQLESSFAECNILREQFDAWFTGDLTPLEKLRDALKDEGNLNLQGTLDVRNCEKVQGTITRIRNDLKYLDDILKRAAQAYGMDVQKLQRRALGSTPK